MGSFLPVITPKNPLVSEFIIPIPCFFLSYLFFSIKEYIFFRAVGFLNLFVFLER
jgi:hypothetical protein